MFSIPMEGDPEATEQLNAFFRSQKVLSIETAAVAAGDRQSWSAGAQVGTSYYTPASNSTARQRRSRGFGSAALVLEQT
ncbi:MAG: hypothetical protein R3F49_02030 [Planctomycetota bacterium]